MYEQTNTNLERVIVMLIPCPDDHHATQEVVMAIHDLNTNPDTKQLHVDDQICGPVIKALEQWEPLPAALAPGLRQGFLQNGLLCRTFQPSTASIKIQLVVPISMQNLSLTKLHNVAGIHKTADNVKERFYWPGYEADIQKWIRECQQCQR